MMWIFNFNHELSFSIPIGNFICFPMIRNASYSVAGASAPARATSLIMRDSRAQTALSIFLGAFIFSIVSLVALSTGYYGPKGRVILFGVTVAVLSAVIWTVIRWIGQLSDMGQLANVIKKIETASTKSITTQNYLFFNDDVKNAAPENVTTLKCDVTGFIQTLDLQGLSELVKTTDGEIWIEVSHGEFVYPGLALAKFSCSEKDEKKIRDSIRSHFFIGDRRTFEDDLRFGLIVLSEIASHALSPGINDPGSAIEIIASLLRVISKMQEALCSEQKRWWPNKLHLRGITADEVLDDAFHAISRDGASIVEVGIFLQKSLGAISHFPQFSNAAYKKSLQSLKRSKNTMKSQEDIERLLHQTSWHKSFH
jgi:uncharacterized membrane protein